MSLALNTCRSCHRRAIDAFIALAGATISTSRMSLQTRQPSLLPSRFPMKRSIHMSSPWSQQITDDSDATRSARQHSLDDELVSDPLDSSIDSTPSSPPASEDAPAHVPWYLQVTTPEPLSPTSTPNIAAQALPPLPADPPAILPSLLSHLSISIGLDHLTILDLRDLNPPSALGANLLMILGTARSEKHLNTSADRFCRWLRSTYKLRPFADGLLGRNELKLKLRRRNKKMKLAQSVGNTTTFGDGKTYDDGITTGWICCNIGAVDGVTIPVDQDALGSVSEHIAAVDSRQTHPVLSQKDQERILEDEEDEYKNPSDQDFKYRGFGNASTAPRVVVQMFTEEKRHEMDLEGLWEVRIKRRDAKAEKQERNFQEDSFETERIEQDIREHRT